MNTLILIGLVVAVTLGIVAVLASKGKSWAGWACVVGFGVLLLARIA